MKTMKLTKLRLLFLATLMEAIAVTPVHNVGLGRFLQEEEQALEDLNSTSSSSNTTKTEESKYLKICSVLGGLDLVRLRSTEARTLFQGALDDVELIREYFSQAVDNGALAGGLSDLDDLSNTLDWQARGLNGTNITTTLEAGLGYADDRPDRQMDRLVSNSTNLPFVGDKQVDAVMMDVVSNILPWIVDRKKHEDLWTMDHQNGRSQAPGSEPLVFESLYMAAYVLSWGDTIWYYPPLAAQYGHPLALADVLGGNFDSHDMVTGAGFLPDENPLHLSAFYGPYPDVGIPGHALITATTPLYYTGDFMGYSYNDTYIAHVGLDMSMDSISALLDDLEDALVPGSFALLVNTTLSPIAISQSVVSKIYPERTGMEESRVTYQLSDGSIVNDRRNQTYLVSDTLHEALIDIPSNRSSANWSALAEEIAHLERGGRGYMTLNITLTNTDKPVPYYVMFDRWQYVSDWVALVLAPVEQVDRAVDVQFSNATFRAEAKATRAATSNKQDDETTACGTLLLQNTGRLDVRVAPSAWPSWLSWQGDAALLVGNPITLEHGSSMPIDFCLSSASLQVGTSISTVSFRVVDDGYADCFYDRDVSFDAILKVNPLEIDQNYIGNTVYAGYFFFALVLATAFGFVAWTAWNWNHRVVRCSQPRFLVMLCVGTIIMSSSIITFGIDDDNASVEGANQACMASVWLVSMGFIISFCALFSKIWRINKIFHNPSFQRITVTEQDVLIPFAILFAINFALLLTWTLWDPLRFERVQVDSNNPFSDTYGTCQFEEKGSIGIAVAILAVNFCAILLALFEAYRAREISDEFSESKWIGITVASWFQVVVVGFPVLFLVQEKPTAGYFLKTSIIFVACMSLLLFIFVPKFFIQQRDDGTVRGSTITMAVRGSTNRMRKRNNSNDNMVPFSVYGPTSDNNFGGPSQPFAAPSSADGLKIIRQPAYSSAAQTAQTDAEEQMQTRIQELEQQVSKLEEEKKSLEKKLWTEEKEAEKKEENGEERNVEQAAAEAEEQCTVGENAEQASVEAEEQSTKPGDFTC